MSNLPTVWTNVLAGAVLAAPIADPGAVATMAAAMSALYTAGMFLNDAFDRRFDAAHRPDRPIPAGEVHVVEAFAIGFGLLMFGLGLAAGVREEAVAWTVALAACIVFYDWRHKGAGGAPLVMGACRGLVYCATAAAVAVATPTIVAWAAVMTLYVAGVSLWARHAAPSRGWSVAWLIAGISLLDAIAVASRGEYALAAAAAVGFPLTLAAQRLVRGT